MLAQSFSHHHVHHDLPSSRMTTSLMVTPPMCTQPSQPTSSSHQSRPKLSLNTNTTHARTFGKGSSLRLETLSAVSPTAINTFANAYEPERTPTATPGRPTRPKLSIDSSVQPATKEPGTAETQDSRTPSSSSVSSASTLNSATIPYSISQVLNSVLANSPLQPRANIRRMSLRPRFPAEKRVSFRTPLVEDIVNTKYTLAHSDLVASDHSDTASSISIPSDDGESEQASSLTSSPDSMESTLSLEQPTDGSDSDTVMRTGRSPARSHPHRRRRLPHRPRSKTSSPQAGDKRDSSSESDSDVCPETPVAGRRKKQRQWTWTLGSLPGQSGQMSTSDEDTANSTSTSTLTSSLASTITSSESS